MGRKGQVQRASLKKKNQRNLTISTDEKELLINVDKLLRISTIPQQTNVLKALENQREIQGITEKIKQLQLKLNKNPAETSADKRATGAIVDNFTKWVRENGAEFKCCQIAEFDGYDLGLKVNVNIPESSLVIAMPRKLMMSIEAANRSVLKNLMERDQILKNMPNVALAIFLLIEKFKGDDSFWKAYIDILPLSYTTVLYFNCEELEELKGSPTLEVALRQIKSIARQYAYFHQLFATSDDAVSTLMKGRFTFNEYCWAVSTIMTRQNTIPSSDGQQMINALIPLWDLCNHTNGTISTDYNPDLDRCECLALRDFKAGEQLFIFYGARSNADLFIHNGFVYEDNEHDGYWIRLGISRSDALQEKRNELLSRLEISTTCDFFIKKGPQPINGKLLAFVRIFSMNEDQLQHWLESDRSGDLQYIECALDTVLEKKSWSFMQARLKLLLASYKTTLEHDLKLLQAPSGTADVLKRLAIQMRASEKKILTYTLEYVEQYINQ